MQLKEATAKLQVTTTFIVNTTHRWRKVLKIGGVGGHACVSTHVLGKSGCMVPQFKIRCSEIASEVIFVLKFIFGLDATRIPGLSAFGAPLAMFRDC